MGSLVPGWDSRKGGKTPRKFRDYDDSSPIPTSKDSTAHHQHPPNLNRSSAPGRIYAVTVHPSSPRAAQRPALARISTDSSSHSSPKASSTPTSPTLAAIRVATATHGGIGKFIEIGHHQQQQQQHEDIHHPHNLTAVLHEKERWFDRMDSAGLNAPVDDPEESLDSVRKHGSFVPDDPLKLMHLLHVHDPVTTTKTGAPEAEKSGEGAEEKHHVAVERLVNN